METEKISKENDRTPKYRKKECLWRAQKQTGEVEEGVSELEDMSEESFPDWDGKAKITGIISKGVNVNIWKTTRKRKWELIRRNAEVLIIEKFPK